MVPKSLPSVLDTLDGDSFGSSVIDVSLHDLPQRNALGPTQSFLLLDPVTKTGPREAGIIRAKRAASPLVGDLVPVSDDEGPSVLPELGLPWLSHRSTSPAAIRRSLPPSRN